MRRKEIEQKYDIDEAGRIRTPGKFKGEMIYVPSFWDIYVKHCANRHEGELVGFDVTGEDRREFPELGKRRQTVNLVEDDRGFVREV